MSHTLFAGLFALAILGGQWLLGYALVRTNVDM